MKRDVCYFGYRELLPYNLIVGQDVTVKIAQNISGEIGWEEMVRDRAIAGHSLVYFQETDSTNARAMEMGLSGAQTGTVVLADSQTGGKGRLGRFWLSPAGSGLYFSVILRPRLEMGDLSKITLVAGVALCRAVRRLYSFVPQMKWPNDLLIANRKCGGILVEADLRNQSVPLIILGIGLNATTPLSSFPEEFREVTTSLQCHVDKPILRKELLEAVLVETDALIGQFEGKGFSEILNEWKKYDATLGKILTWITADRKVVKGVSLGPDNEGRLHIHSSDGIIHEVLSGDIRLANHD